ncbi:ferredoxin--NADP reductase [Candidatus Kinetoplastidibacterium crithidiae]|uniref:ferredoxin--NADP(+) reductase n=1 Tax=Candidatus Kinetoplastidibacterium crithidiae TCC036E TaxID=1208918 RepID=M1LX43_9PROT|nr:ferredoxin--NADP reductase [Candidatus Kinetoplastibacterium crithidii]AGF47759.1 ferredoxin--NADP+ reductase [Candidatus Kinetoplastibacterium crithidii TCC036E]
MIEAKLSKNYTSQIIENIKIWKNDSLFSIKTTKDASYNFQPGQFARLGLINQNNNTLIWRAYSIVSAPHEDFLEFYYTIINKGEFSKILLNLKENDNIFIEKSIWVLNDKSICWTKYKEKNNKLWLIATGTGLSAYISILRDHKTWKYFDKIFLIHSTKFLDELSYKKELEILSKTNKRFKYLPVTTREKSSTISETRITSLVMSGNLETLTKEKLDPESSKIMLCGNPTMVLEMRKILYDRGFYTSKQHITGNLAMERYWI